MGIRQDAKILLLWTVLLWTFLCMLPAIYTCASFSWSGIVELSGTECSILQENYKLFSNWLYQFILLPATYRRCSWSTYSATGRGFLICVDRMCVKPYFIMGFICISWSQRRVRILQLHCSQEFPFLWTAHLCLLLIFSIGFEDSYWFVVLYMLLIY